MALEEIRLVHCGDRALLCYLGDTIDLETNQRVHALTRALRQQAHPAVMEVAPAFCTVLVEFDPVRLRPDQAEELVRKAAAEAGSMPTESRTVEIPVLYGGEAGPDLATVANQTGLSPEAVVQRHAQGLYRVYCLGFSPGFPYLGGLDPALQTPRLAEPRTLVPGGSVGIGGEQTGIYPAPSPGGWQLIGRSPAPLFDPYRAEPSLLQPGDQIRFAPITPEAFAGLEATAAHPAVQPPAYQPGRTGLRVLQPGLMTTVQDLGRRGYTGYGVPVAGAADFWSLMVGNWLLGNRARAGALEITLSGPEVEFTGPTAFALTGAPVPAELIPADGSSPRPVAGWSTVLASPGDRLRIGTATTGCRCYLCVAGGLDLPPVLGSISEDLFGKIGPFRRPLKTGDWLPIGLPIHGPADLAGRVLPNDAIPVFEGSAVLRATRGPQAEAFTPGAIGAFFAEEYQVGSQSDRQGLRLQGPKLAHLSRADIISEPIAPGAVQVPANGQPILLLNNRQTTGGYTKMATVLYSALPMAAQLRPGDRLRFQEVDAEEAHAYAWAERRRLAQIRRYLEREIQQRADLPTPPVAALRRTQPTAAPAAEAPSLEGARTFRITIGSIEFMAEVEEVKE